MTPGGDTPERDAGGPLVSRDRRVLDFARRLASKAMDDNIFFMAGAIAFNFLVALVPLVLLGVGIGGFVARARFVDPSGVIVGYILEGLPAVRGDVNLAQNVRGIIDGVIDERAGLSLIGAIFLIWISTRLVGTLRTALAEVFDIGQRRGLIGGKLFDAQIVVVGGALFLLNIAVTVLLQAVGWYGIDLMDLQGRGVHVVRELLAIGLAFASIWVFFLLIYRYLPARRIPWRTAVVAATFMAVLYEAMKGGFSWYATNLANFRSAFGNLTTAAVLFIWIYYGSVVFILGGEVAQIYTMNRVRRLRIREAITRDES